LISLIIDRFHQDGLVTIYLTWRNRILVVKLNPYLWSALTAIATWCSIYFFLGPGLATVIILSLLIHELGHATLAVIYRLDRINIEFVPFLGARLIFQQNFPSRAAGVLLVLAGPAAGLVTGWLAYGLFILTDWPYALAYAVWSMILTLVNLMPLSPLDGGHATVGLLAPAKINVCRLAQFFGVLMVHVGLYILGLSLLIVVPSAILALMFTEREMRKLTDGERIYNKLSYLFGLPSDDVVAIQERVRRFDNEQLILTIAAQARQLYHRWFIGRLNYITEDCEFSDRESLHFYLCSLAQRPMSHPMAALLWLVYVVLIASTLFLAIQALGIDGWLIKFAITAFML